jgi:outer membrane protein assembly factor BamB
MARLCLMAALALATPLHSNADNGSYAGTGGTFSTGTGSGQNISVQGLPLSGTTATLAFNCPITFYGAGTYQINWTCSGGSISIASTDNSLAFNGTFSSGSMTFSGGGGGRGGHVTYWYQFSGSVTGTITVGGVTEGMIGSISQSVKTSSQLGSSSAPVYGLSLGWNSAYSPVVVGDLSNSRLLSADNITGANPVSYGNSGSGTGHFGTIAGLAQDASGRIYITDSAQDHLVRIDDMTGKNWAQLGSSGTGSNQFNGPLGVTVDSSGKIWVADSGNNRIVRFDDLTGKNWTSFGTLGSGANQFNAPSGIAFDAQGRIYVTDNGNQRLVRFDDLTGTNWTALTQVNIDPYGYPIVSAVGVTVRPSGLIEIALGNGDLLSFTDMTGANGTAISLGSALAGMSVDNAGTIYLTGSFVPGMALVVNASGAGYFASEMGGAAFQAGPILALASTSPTPAVPAISTKSLSFGSQNVGEPGAAQQFSITNIGADSLTISSITADADYKLANGCPASLGGGATCMVTIQFDPAETGVRNSSLSIETASVRPLLSVALSGVGTAPTAVVTPGTLTFQPQKTATASSAQTLTLSNTGTGPLTIGSIAVTGDYSETNNCPTVVVPGNGCAINVLFQPSASGSRAGALTIMDDALPSGTQQTVTLLGTGIATAPAFTLTPESLYFPDQLKGSTSNVHTATLTNNSGATVSLTAAVFPAGFRGNTSCPATLKTGASCVIRVYFVPVALGPVSASVSIPIANQPSLSLGVSGTGTPLKTPAALSVNPASVDFGAMQVGDNPSLSATITNTSDLPKGIQWIVLSGSAVFTLTGNTCPTVLAGGASCTIQVTYQPTVSGIFSGNLRVLESTGTPTDVPVSGSATINGGM